MSQHLILLTSHRRGKQPSPAPVATQIVVTTQPVGAVSGSALNTQPVVQILDQYGHFFAGFVGAVTVAIAGRTGAVSGFGALSGTTTVNCVAGVGTFTDLVMTTEGTYTFVITGSGLLSATSSAAVITPLATKLVITQQPTLGVMGNAFSPAIIVQAQSPHGTLVTTFTNNVTLAVASGPGGGAVGGTATVAAVGGVATFGAASLSPDGTFTVTASASGVSSVTSANIVVSLFTASTLPAYIDNTKTPLIWSTKKRPEQLGVTSAATMSTADLTDGQQTWYPGMPITSGMYCANADAASDQYTDIAIDATDSACITSAARPFTSVDLGRIMYNTGGAGFTRGSSQLYRIVFVDPATHKAWLGDAAGFTGFSGIPLSAGTASSTGGTYLSRPDSVFAPGGTPRYWQAGGNGTAEIGPGPHGAGPTYNDNGVTWTAIGTIAATPRVAHFAGAQLGGSASGNNAKFLNSMREESGVQIARITYAKSDRPFTQAVIGGPSGTDATLMKVESAIVPGLVQAGATTVVHLTGGSGFNTDPSLAFNVASTDANGWMKFGSGPNGYTNWGAAGSTNGVGFIRIGQQGPRLKPYMPGSTGSKNAVVTRFMARFTPHAPTDYGMQVKFARDENGADVQGTPQWSTTNDYVGAAPIGPANYPDPAKVSNAANRQWSFINGYEDIGAQVAGTNAPFTVTLTANAAINATTIAVSALAKSLPLNAVLHFGTNKLAVVSSPASLLATSVSVSALPAALSNGDTASVGMVGHPTDPTLIKAFYNPNVPIGYLITINSGGVGFIPGGPYVMRPIKNGGGRNGFVRCLDPNTLSPVNVTDPTVTSLGGLGATGGSYTITDQNYPLGNDGGMQAIGPMLKDLEDGSPHLFYIVARAHPDENDWQGMEQLWLCNADGSNPKLLVSVCLAHMGVTPTNGMKQYNSPSELWGQVLCGDRTSIGDLFWGGDLTSLIPDDYDFDIYLGDATGDPTNLYTCIAYQVPGLRGDVG